MRIAAFDSGVGGLTVIAPILAKFPQAHVHYLGDLANLPYGTKSPERIKELTRLNLESFLEEDSKFDIIVVACNTASAHAINIAEELGAKHKIPVVGVIRPGCRAAIKNNPQRILVLGTSATVQSESYVKTLKEMGCNCPIVQKACPLFVPLVEDEVFDGPAAEWIAKRYLDPILHKGDTIILGCTHYPFLLEMLKRLYPSHTWIDAGAALLQDELFNKTLSPLSRVEEKEPGLFLKFTQPIADASIQKILEKLGIQKTV